MPRNRHEVWAQVMSGKYLHRDYFDYASAEERIAAAESALLNGISMVAFKSYPGAYEKDPRSIYERLPIWC